MRSSTAARGSAPEFGSAPGQPRINSTIAGSRPAYSAERRTTSSSGMVST
jgi:hypothetical protein